MFQREDIKVGIFWRIVEVIGAEFFAFCSFLLLTRLLAPEHFGVVALATMLILIAQIILYQGVGEALVQKYEVDAAMFSSAFWMNIILAAAAALILIAASDAIAAGFSEPRFGPVLRTIAPLLLVYAASGILQAKLRRDLQLKGFAAASIFATICGAVVAAVMAVKGFEVWSLVAQQWTYGLVSTAMFFACARWGPRLFVKVAHLREIAGFSFNTIGAALLRFSLRQVDLLFLGFFLPSRQVGLYFLASRILYTVGQLTYYSIQRIGLPVLSRLQNDPERHQAAIISTFKLTFLVCLPIFLGMAATADLAIPIIFGAEWADSVPPFRILCLFSIFYALSLITNQVLLSIGMASTVFRLSVFNALVFVFAVAFAAPQ
ncbi:MAG: oligosaccharide flippase family protein, partial [Geminicoccaceae bacterium]